MSKLRWSRAFPCGRTGAEVQKRISHKSHNTQQANKQVKTVKHGHVSQSKSEQACVTAHRRQRRGPIRGPDPRSVYCGKDRPSRSQINSQVTSQLRTIYLYMPTPVPKYRAHAAHAPLTCHTLNTQHFTDCGQTTHRSVHARHPGRRCTSRCQCLPVPQSRVPGSAHGYTPGGRGPGPAQ